MKCGQIVPGGPEAMSGMGRLAEEEFSREKLANQFADWLESVEKDTDGKNEWEK